LFFDTKTKAPVFEEAKMSAMQLGKLRQHQLLEILGYNSTRWAGSTEKDVGVETLKVTHPKTNIAS